MTWPTLNIEQRVYLIKSVWREGMTARQIGDAVGASKGAIIGFYYRHRAALSGTPMIMGDVEKKRTGTLSPETIKRYERAAAKKERDRIKAETDKAFSDAGLDLAKNWRKEYGGDFSTVDTVGLYVRLEDNNGCSWPLNDGGPYLFCGHGKIDKSSYCQHHHDRSKGPGTESERRALSGLKKVA